MNALPSNASHLQFSSTRFFSARRASSSAFFASRSDFRFACNQREELDEGPCAFVWPTDSTLGRRMFDDDVDRFGVVSASEGEDGDAGRTTHSSDEELLLLLSRSIWKRREQTTVCSSARSRFNTKATCDYGIGMVVRKDKEFDVPLTLMSLVDSYWLIGQRACANKNESKQQTTTTTTRDTR